MYSKGESVWGMGLMNKSLVVMSLRFSGFVMSIPTAWPVAKGSCGTDPQPRSRERCCLMLRAFDFPFGGNSSCRTLLSR